MSTIYIYIYNFLSNTDRVCQFTLISFDDIYIRIAITKPHLQHSRLAACAVFVVFLLKTPRLSINHNFGQCLSTCSAFAHVCKHQIDAERNSIPKGGRVSS